MYKFYHKNGYAGLVLTGFLTSGTRFLHTLKKPVLKKWIMRINLTVFLLSFSLLQLAFGASAQRITLSKKNVPITDVFKEIKRQSGYDFVYQSKVLKSGKPVTIDVSNLSLQDALEKCFKGQPFTYSLENKTVIVIPKKDIIPHIKDIAGPYIVSGKVVDENNRPLAGATVVLKGRQTGTVTDKNGTFLLQVNVTSQELSNLTLLVTYIGYDPLAFAVNQKLDVQTIVLKEHSSNLDQVQIQAYGQTSRRLNTGNIGTVNSDDIAKQPVTNVLEAIGGRIPGVFVTQASGLPNSTVNILIRGTNTISQSVSPLYVIDGLPYTPNMLLNAGTSGSGQASPLAFLNPSSIESINVLKDADATAIYGSRGANGVVLITTKKGVTGKTQVEANVYTGSSTIPQKVELMNTEQYLAMRREAFANDGITPTASNAPDLFTWDPGRYTDWTRKLLGQSSVTTNAQVSISGGTAAVQYRAYGAFNRSTPPFPGDFSNRKTSAGLSLTTASADKKFNATFGANYLADRTYLPQYDPTTNIFIGPNAPDPLNPDGSLNFIAFPSPNPLSGFRNWYKGNTSNLLSNINIGYEVLPALVIKVTGGYNISTVNGVGATTIASNAGNPQVTNPTGSANFSYNTISSWIAEPQVTYSWNFLKGKWNALAGTTFQQNNTNGQLITGGGYSNDALLNSLAASSTISKGSSNNEQSKFTSVYSRLNYNYGDEYLLNLTGRRDGSSRFGPGSRFGNFGAIGAAWIFTKEDLVSENLPFLSFGKIRASYGITGNEPGSNYQYLSLNTFLSPTRPYQGTAAISTDNLLSTNYAWEQVKKLEGGLELGFLKDRILGSVSYFGNRSSNQLVNYTVPAITGYNSVLVNRDATIQNSGVEFTLNTTNIISRDFQWKTNFNLTISRNKLVAFPDLANTPYKTSLVVGLPLSVSARYRAAGVDPQTGVYQFYTKDNKLTFNPEIEDATDFTSFDPIFFGGVQNSLTYRRFSLDFFLQFVKQKGNNPYFNSALVPGEYVSGNGNEFREFLNRWQKPGDIATYERYTTSGNSAAYNGLFYQQQSTAAITDASYIRLKNVSFSYDVPENVIRHLKLQKARLYFQAQNLITISKYPGLDPESQTYLPPLSIWTIGTQITF